MIRCVVQGEARFVESREQGSQPRQLVVSRLRVFKEIAVVVGVDWLDRVGVAAELNKLVFMVVDGLGKSLVEGFDIGPIPVVDAAQVLAELHPGARGHTIAVHDGAGGMAPGVRPEIPCGVGQFVLIVRGPVAWPSRRALIEPTPPLARGTAAERGEADVQVQAYLARWVAVDVAGTRLFPRGLVGWRSTATERRVGTRGGCRIYHG